MAGPYRKTGSGRPLTVCRPPQTELGLETGPSGGAAKAKELMTTAVYPGSFDPVHNGHIDVAERASRIFDHLVVAVFALPLKNVLFGVDERTEMLKQALQHLPNVTVARYEGMTVDFVREQNAQVIVRGLRMMYDFDREYQMALTNQAFAPGIETVCLFTNLNNSFLSSSMVKEIARAGGDVSSMAPAHVVKSLHRQFAGDAG